MPFRVACPSCDHELNLRDDLLGKRIRCSECGEAMTAKPASPIRSQDVKAPAIRKNRETIEEEDEVSETASKKKKRKSDASTSRDIPWGLVLGGAAAFVTVSILVVIVVMLGRG